MMSRIALSKMKLVAMLAVLSCGRFLLASAPTSAAPPDPPRRLAHGDGAVEVIDLDALIDGEIIHGRVVDEERFEYEIEHEFDETWTDPWEAYQQELLARERHGCLECLPNTNRPRSWQILPDGLIYRSYLAGVREPRMATHIFNDRDEGALADSTIGARVGLLRHGTQGPAMVQGFQLDFEAAALLRQDLDVDLEVVSTDFRAGIPLTFGFGRYQTKLAYYHLSAHLGDEFIERTGTPRINYVRDVIVWGHSLQVTNDVRVYGEVGWSFYNDGGSEPWEFQFGMEYSPICKLGPRGAPFFALNGHLREEVNFGGNLTVQTGWQWRSRVGGPLFRIGLHYLNGESPQYEFFDAFEHQLGLGIWYDF